MKSDEEITLEAIEYVRTHKKVLLEKFCPAKECYPVTSPISLFMAGSPGAGKTEVSKGLIKRFEDVPVRIDADEVRSMCPSYTGTNAHLFQKAANKGVNILFDHCLQHNLNCVLDGTFAYGGAEKNIQRSIDHKRKVEIWFIYQNPLRAWEFTKARELHEARRVSKEVFIRAFVESRKNVCAMKDSFGAGVELNILVKDYALDTHELYLNKTAKELDGIIDAKYSVDDLENILV